MPRDLDAYRGKRRADATPEPSGDRAPVDLSGKSLSAPRVFVHGKIGWDAHEQRLQVADRQWTMRISYGRFIDRLGRPLAILLFGVAIAFLAIRLHQMQHRRLGAFQALAEEKERHAEDRELMIGEMAHRMKNAFARIGALARITVRESKDLADFETRFDGRLRALSDAGRLPFPAIAANDAACKHMFDNRYGTGQSTIQAILQLTNLRLAGKRVVVVGYGWVGRGIATYARALGARRQADVALAHEVAHPGDDGGGLKAGQRRQLLHRRPPIRRRGEGDQQPQGLRRKALVARGPGSALEQQPHSALIANKKAFGRMADNPWWMTNTFAGSQLACAAALASLEVYEKENLLQQCRDKGAYLKEKLGEIVKRYPGQLKEVRGLGLWVGFELHTPELGTRMADELLRLAMTGLAAPAGPA